MFVTFSGQFLTVIDQLVPIYIQIVNHYGYGKILHDYGKLYD